MKLGKIAIASFLGSASLSVVGQPAQAQSVQSKQVTVNVPAGDLVSGLRKLSRQARVEIIFNAAELRGLRTAGARGSLSIGEAVSRLVAASGARTVRDPSGAFLVSPRATEAPLTAREKVVSANDAPRAEPISDDNYADDIIVTATRQSSSISKVPVSMTALNQEGLDVQGIKSIDDLSRITPGIAFQRAGAGGLNLGNQSRISIRGISSGFGASTTGIYIDDTPIQTRNAGYTSTNVFPALFDLERVEVLRGPQGTLFGSGSEGGTIRFITPDPNLAGFSKYARAELAATQNGQPSYEVGFAVGGPIVEDKLGFRGSVFYRRDGGWIDRVDRLTGAVAAKDENHATSFVVRGALTWSPVSDLKITPSIFYQDLKAVGGTMFWKALSDPDEGIFRSGEVLSSPSRDKFSLSALKIDHDFGGVQLISNSSYLDRDAQAFPDYTQYVRAIATGQPYPLIAGEFSRGHFIDQQKGFTQEVRLQSTDSTSPLNWVVGVFYNRTKQSDLQIIEGPFFPQIIFDTYGLDYRDIYGAPLGAMDSIYTNHTRTTDKQIAGFGQVDYAITPKLKATVGVRYAKVDFSFLSTNDGPTAGDAVDSGTQSESPFTPKFGLSYQADGANLFYASASKGFRPGGAQRVPASACAADVVALGLSRTPSEYQSDSVWSYEVGSKNRLFGGQLSVNSSAYWIDWSNIQQFVALPSCDQGFIANLGKAVSRGFDVDATLRVSDSLTLSGQVGYTDAYSKTGIESGVAVIAIKGGPISSISPWTVHLSGQYDFPVTDQRAYARIDYDYASQGPKPDIRLFGTDPILFRRPETHQVSMRAGMKFDRVDVSLFANNLTNSTAILSRNRPPGLSSLFLESTFRPRTMGITLSYRD